MPDPKITDLAVRFGWGDDAVEAVQSLLDGSRRGGASILDALARSPGIHEPVPIGVPDVVEPASATLPASDVISGEDPDDRVVPTAHGEASSASRFEDLGQLGIGGMGQVRRVRDLHLNRTMAMKLIGDDDPSAETLSRFVEEAQVTAQLGHPSIPPVHQLGQLADGRLFFTMKEVRGRTFTEVIQTVHTAARDGLWRSTPDGWSLRRLIDAFRKICEAVAFAHEHGVIHRDLKPSNVMIGAFGEVMVVDWGLARTPRTSSPVPDADSPPTIQTARSTRGQFPTRLGTVAGTPAYMPPEQAAGALARIGPWSDVFALGAILHQVLTGGPPIDAESERCQWPARTLSPAPVPEELVTIGRRALRRHPDERYADASEMAAEVASWLDGVLQQDRADALVGEAADARWRSRNHRSRGLDLQRQAAEALAQIPQWSPAAEKTAAWELENRALAESSSALEADLQVEGLLRAAFHHVPDHAEAHAALANWYRDEHRAAEERRDSAGARRAEAQLERSARALPEAHRDRIHHIAYLAGDGQLTLATDPPGAEVLLHRFELRERRLTAVSDRNLGQTPLDAVRLPMGSYLCVLRKEGHDEVRYPVSIARQTHWDGVRPDGSTSEPIVLPAAGTIPGSCVYVPAGWFVAGGDESAPMSGPLQRWWCDGFLIHRKPVTNADYLVFMNDLVARGRDREALEHVPRERGATGAPIYGRTEDGRFQLVPDADGDLWLPDWPAIMVNVPSALAYAAWLRDGTGHDWRLPAELEWEKAARGVDGRNHPWGDFHDPSCCAMVHSFADRPLPSSVDGFDGDTSVYGVGGMAGNTSDWCADVWRPERVLPDVPIVTIPRVEPAEAQVLRGGHFNGHRDLTRCARRNRDEVTSRSPTLGFRLACSWPSP